LRFEIPWYLSAGPKKPFSAQLREALRLYRLYRYPPYHYVKHGLFLKSCKANVEEYIPPELIMRYRDSCNPPEAHDLVRDKLRFERILSEAGLPVVSTLALIHSDGSLTDTEGNRLEALPDPAEEKRLVLKPRYSGQGRGVRVLDAGRSGKLRVDPKAFAAELFQASGVELYLIQPYITQHPLLAEMNPTSVNTLRIDTFIEGEKVYINSALLRVGGPGSLIDNLCQGGLLVGVDLSRGRLKRFGRTGAAFGGDWCERHPGTGFRFEGTELPFFKEALSLVKEAAPLLLPLRCLGWDLILTPGGPVFLEANHDYGVFSLQEARGGYRSAPLGRALLGKTPIPS